MRLLWADPGRRLRPTDTDVRGGADVDVAPPSLARPMVLGFLATTAITIGASQPASPFSLKQPDAWFFGIPDPGAHAQGLLLSLVLVFAGMLVFSRIWYDLARALDRHNGVPVRRLAVMFAIWPCWWRPPCSAATCTATRPRATWSPMASPRTSTDPAPWARVPT
jgi:hypothetical protein